MEQTIEKKDEMLIDSEAVSILLSNMNREMSKANSVTKLVTKGFEQANEDLLGNMEIIMELHKKAVSKSIQDGLKELEMDKDNNIEGCSKCKERIKEAEEQYNKLNEKVRRLRKEKEEIAMLTKYRILPYLIFFFISAILLAVFTTLHVVWRITGFKFVNPVTSFMFILMSIGWGATAFVGIIYKRKENF